MKHFTASVNRSVFQVKKIMIVLLPILHVHVWHRFLFVYYSHVLERANHKTVPVNIRRGKSPYNFQSFLQ